jgi:hypothetical protein
MGELIPFDPNLHKPVYLDDSGIPSTEYSASETSPEGGAWNIPQIWFDSETGKHQLLVGDAAWDQAFEYEERTGKKFPRFDTIPMAETAARKRSNAGGASSKALTD